VAPLLFSGVAEYPVVLVLACMLRPAPAEDPLPDLDVEVERRRKRQRVRPAAAPEYKHVPSSRHWILRPRSLDFILPAILGLVTAGMVLLVQSSIPGHSALSV